MKVIYHSALIDKELEANGVFRTFPCKATLELQREKQDTNFDVIYNGKIIETTGPIACYEDGELVIRSNGERQSYRIKSLVRPLSNEYALAYEQFGYEYLEKKSNEIESIQQGALKMYAVDQSTEVHDWTEVFDKIEQALPAFKAICEKPKSHLKAVNEVRPIETVKRIGYESIPYLAAHSEDWLARTASGLKPARLFSRVEDDEYQIYENRVAKTLIDQILSFLRKKEKELRDQYEQLHGIINSSVQTGSFGFDVSFQKAVAELMISDNKGDEYRSKALELVDKLHKRSIFLLKKYRSLRQSRLYRYLKKAKGVTNPLNETNILLMDKHYSVVYKLWRDIHKEIVPQDVVEKKVLDFNFSYDDYTAFCKTLCGYAAHVLNFEIISDGIYRRKEDELELSIKNEGDLIKVSLQDIERRRLPISPGTLVPLNPGESYKSFSLDNGVLSWDYQVTDSDIDEFCSKLLPESRYSTNKNDAARKNEIKEIKAKEYARTELKRIVTDFNNNCSSGKAFTFAILPIVAEIDSETRNSFKTQAEEYAKQFMSISGLDLLIIALPTCNEEEQKVISYAKYAQEKTLILPLTMFDINSFRRVQNVLLQLITKMEKGKCPACGGIMRQHNNQRICDHCNGLILTPTTCPNEACHKEYYYIGYDVNESTIEKMREVDKDNFYQWDSLFQYKDIVPMVVESEKVRTVCPHCGK